MNLFYFWDIQIEYVKLSWSWTGSCNDQIWFMIVHGFESEASMSLSLPKGKGISLQKDWAVVRSLLEKLYIIVLNFPFFKLVFYKIQ